MKQVTNKQLQRNVFDYSQEDYSKEMEQRYENDLYFLFYYFITFIAQIHKKITLVQKGNPEQAHRPTKWGPLFTHQKLKDMHNYRQTTEENKEIL